MILIFEDNSGLFTEIFRGKTLEPLNGRKLISLGKIKLIASFGYLKRVEIKVYNSWINIQNRDMKTLIFLVIFAVLFSNAFASADNSFLRISQRKPAPLKECPAGQEQCGLNNCCYINYCCFTPVYHEPYCCDK